MQLPGDPTQPANFTPVKRQKVIVRRSYSVSYIKADEQNSAAIINGTLVSLGDRVDGARVLAIDPERVTLRTPTGVRHFVLGASANIKKEVSKSRD